MPRVCWTDKAEQSVLEIGRYIIDRTQSRERGLDVITRIEEKCARYAEFPEGGTKRPDLGPGLRCFPVENIIVVYRPIQDGIAIILVAHGHQDVGTIVEKIMGRNE
jgi:toxin ParE1/3/4